MAEELPATTAEPITPAAAVAVGLTAAVPVARDAAIVTELASTTAEGVLELGGNATGLSGVVSAVERGDAVQATIAATGAITNNAGTVVSAMTTAGKEVSEELIGGLGRSNLIVSAVDGVYQISQEDSVEHAAQRTAAVAANIGTGVAVGSVISGGLTVGGVAATGAAAAVTTVAAPVVAGAAAAMVVGKTADGMIEVSRAYESLEEFKPTENFKSMIGMQGVLGARMDELGAERGANGKFDMADPKTAEVFGQALQEHRAHQDELVASTKSVLPSWLQLTESQIEKRGNHEVAKMDAQLASAASEEYSRYMTELKAYQENQHTQSMDTAKAQALAALSPSLRQSIQMERQIESVSQGMENQPMLAVSDSLKNSIQVENTSISDISAQAVPSNISTDKSMGIA